MGLPKRRAAKETHDYAERGKYERGVIALSLQGKRSMVRAPARSTPHNVGLGIVAKSYLEFLFTEPAQEIMATHHYRPIAPAVLERHRNEFPRIELFPIRLVAVDWEDAQHRFFDDNGVFDSVAPRRTAK